MGGLVCRAATALLPSWHALLTHVVCLGSPHGGAPLARFGHAATRVFQTIDLPATQILGRILDRRSVGVKELRHRSLQACGPLVPHARYLLVAGSVTFDPQVFGTAWLGDLLVPVESAHAPEGPQVRIRHFGGVLHHRLQANAAVYAAVREHLTGQPLLP